MVQPRGLELDAFLVLELEREMATLFCLPQNEVIVSHS